jgi:hypothetical protein
MRGFVLIEVEMLIVVVEGYYIDLLLVERSVKAQPDQ